MFQTQTGKQTSKSFYLLTNSFPKHIACKTVSSRTQRYRDTLRSNGRDENVYNPVCLDLIRSIQFRQIDACKGADAHQIIYFVCKMHRNSMFIRFTNDSNRSNRAKRNKTLRNFRALGSLLFPSSFVFVLSLIVCSFDID